MPLRLIDEAENREYESVKDKKKKKKMLSGGQAKLDKNKNNKLDAQDFKILRAEKAKGRGQGLQDEKMKPGKPMKAVLGAIALGFGAKKMLDKNKNKSPLGMGAAAAIANKKKEILGKRMGGAAKYRAGKSIKVKDDSSFSKKMELQEKGVIDKKTGAGRERITKAVKATSLGKRLLLPVAGAVAVGQYLKKKMKEKKERPMKKMGGGMMQRPMGGYTSGGSVTVKTKIGKYFPTKTY